MTGTYNELGIARGSAPTAQQAVDQAKVHCGQHGGTHLIMNTKPFQSGSSYKVDATCATVGALKASAAELARTEGEAPPRAPLCFKAPEHMS